MSYHNLNSSSSFSRANDQGQVAPPGYHYMPDGSLMLDSEMPNNIDEAEESIGSRGFTIRSFDLDLSDLPAISERRHFTISGDKGAEFKLEIKDNTTGYYYNFVTNVFQASASSLEEKISSSSYGGSITFPAVTGGDDQYDIFLYAVPSPDGGTRHTAYSEVRFGDGSLDINSSTGSNSLMMQKVIYQYAALTLTLQGYSPNSTVAGTLGTDTVSINRGKPSTKTAFSFTTTAATTAAYRILKQPVSNDVLAFVEPVVGSAPIDLPGENIYPTVTATGNTNAVMSSTATVTMADTIADLELKIGDKVIQATGPYFANIVTVIAITGGGLSAYQFTASEAISVGSGVRLNFHNRVNFSWPITKANLIKPGMIVVPNTDVTANTVVGTYEDKITIFEGTKDEKVIIKNARPAISTVGKKPTIAKGLITAQDGEVVFDKQQVLALAGDTLKIGGYGENEISRVYGWDVRFTDLAIALTAPTTTTTEATSAHATIAVADREGIINTVSTVSGVGINPALANPTLTTGGGLDGAGDWIMSAVQTLESGITLTVGNTGRIATITGNIQIVKAGTASQTLRFDVEKLLSTSAP